jgi:hypothetical protein
MFLQNEIDSLYLRQKRRPGVSRSEHENKFNRGQAAKEKEAWKNSGYPLQIRSGWTFLNFFLKPTS